MTDPKADVRTNDLSVRYGRRLALDDVTLQLSGGVVGILGPNGAGKSTLLGALSTTLPVRPGAAWVGGHDVGTSTGRRSARGVIGWLPQRFDLAGSMTLGDTVAYAAWANGIDSGQAAGHAAEALAAVDLGGRARERVRSLSGGQRQRLGLAAALAHRPAVLLLDEPTVGLDPEQRVRLRELVRDAARDRTVLLSTHLLDDITHAADQVVVIAEGRLLFVGTPEELAELGAARTGDDSAASPHEAGYLTLLRSNPKADE